MVDGGSVVPSEKEIGVAIAAARKKAGLTQQDLCIKAGLSYSTLAKIERGAIKSPSVFTLVAIAQATGVSVEELVGVVSSSSTVAKYKKSTSGISFVYFDINGVLVRFFQNGFLKLSQDSGMSPDLIETTFWHYNDAVCRGEMTVAEFNNILSDRLNMKDIDWTSYYMESVDPIIEAQDLLKWCSQHYRVGLLSNIMPGFIDMMIDKGILPRLPYTAIVDSSKVGSVKPEQRIFEYASDMAGVPEQEILFIDDSRSNLMAAERFDWRVLWFDDYRPKDMVERIKSLLEF